MDRNKIWKMMVILAAIVVTAGSLSKLVSRNSLSLTDYVALHGDPDTAPDNEGREQSPTLADTFDPADIPDPADALSPAGSGDKTSPSSAPEDGSAVSPLTGAALNGDSRLEQRTTFAEGFYYEPLSDKLRRYITGISFPAADEPDTANETDAAGTTSTAVEPDSPMDENAAKPDITLDELYYVHILHYSFDGNPTEGELICNSHIAQDLVEIFHELYRNEYKLEKVLLIDEYNGDDTASMEDNNTSCFCYSAQEDGHAPKHAQGLAVDINPLYNPYIAYTRDGAEKITPAASSAYADRSAAFPYKIDENDLCYKLFIRHGFTWGGNWNDAKGYQHFQKAPDN